MVYEYTNIRRRVTKSVRISSFQTFSEEHLQHYKQYGVLTCCDTQITTYNIEYVLDFKCYRYVLLVCFTHLTTPNKLHISTYVHYILPAEQEADIGGEKLLPSRKKLKYRYRRVICGENDIF